MVARLDSRITVRPGRAEDEAGLARLDAASWTPASGFPSVMERSHDPFFSFFTEDSPPLAHLVAELDGRLAGYLRLRPVTKLPESAHVLGVAGLAVAPGDRRRGVASALLAAAEQHARARGARKLSLRVLGTNAPAMQLYEGVGFRKEGVLRDEFRIGGRYVDDVIMAKHLV
ncbi:MAG TPA: GNAT family N-acetyltransferase [Streptosporangiaceae bacterium]|nr:GNAT family N-acetyltransferase [Streptosporangiaceae bacterium]